MKIIENDNIAKETENFFSLQSNCMQYKMRQCRCTYYRDNGVQIEIISIVVTTVVIIVIIVIVIAAAATAIIVVIAVIASVAVLMMVTYFTRCV